MNLPLATSILATLTLALGIMPDAATAQDVTQRVSIDSTGTQGNWISFSGKDAVSADGRFTLFGTYADNLFPGQVPFVVDLLVHDRLTDSFELVSVSMAGLPSNGNSYGYGISPDGRFVVFKSYADDLVPNDSNSASDIFLRDRLLGTTELINVDLSGMPGDVGATSADVTPDGRFVCFASLSTNLVLNDFNKKADIFLRDRQTGLTERISLDPYWNGGNEHSAAPSISADGRFITYRSLASNLVPGDTNGVIDYFIHDRVTFLTERVSVDSSGNQMTVIGGPMIPAAPVVSDDGRFVAFQTFAADLVAGDTNNWNDVFVRDRQTGTTERVSVSSTGAQAILPPGAFAWDAPSISISADGRNVSFTSYAVNLVPGDTNGATDGFVHDRLTAITERVSVSSNGQQANGESGGVALSPNGRLAVFMSTSDTLVAGDTNGYLDVFVHDRMTGGPELALTNVVAGQTATFTVNGATPGGLIFVGVSLVGQGPIPSAWGPLELGSLDLILPYAADGLGAISTPISLPLGMVGLPLWLQGIDLTMDFPTSVWGGVIQ